MPVRFSWSGWKLIITQNHFLRCIARLLILIYMFDAYIRKIAVCHDRAGMVLVTNLCTLVCLFVSSYQPQALHCLWTFPDTYHNHNASTLSELCVYDRKSQFRGFGG